ncbi:MAG: GNAT family N-acetyltransferase [Cyanobacteria bacterium J06632_22]
MIRDAKPEDEGAIAQLLSALNLFETEEVEIVTGMLAEHFARPQSQDLWLLDDDNGPVGIAYAAPERMTDGTWNLYLIAVHPEHQKQGRGAALLKHVEAALAAQHVRVLLVETAGVEDFEFVRQFYRNSGFREEARISEFYAAGMDKVVFWKRLTWN